jgi:putative transcriptional regulator
VIKPRVDVKAVRAESGLSQAQLAERYGFNVRTLQDWESNRVQPRTAVRAYLIVIDRFPETVKKRSGAPRSAGTTG